MPNDGNLDGMSWIDVYISVVGFLMGFAVGETVVVQYVSEHYSPLVGGLLDNRSRWCFPSVYLLVMIAMVSPLKDDTPSLNVVTHTILGVFVLLMILYVIFEVKLFPYLLVRRSISSNLSASKRHRQHKLTE